MGNGAQFHRLNWLGNPSLAGMQSSAGMMVNYLYDLPALEANAEHFRRRPAAEGQGGGLALGPSVLEILRQT
jgi:hypothetical protein